MCEASGISGAGQALAAIRAGLAYLNSVDAASLPTVTQAEVLKGLEQAEAARVAARSRVLAAFTAQRGFEADAASGARTWLGWQTRVTGAAAAASTAWAKRLAAHPVLAHSLAAGELTTSWARHLSAWTDRLPEDKRDHADSILTAAAAQGADLRDLAGLAEQMRERAAPPDTDPSDDGFQDRWFRLGVTYQGAGRAEGDLSPGCAAALQAVLDALGKNQGPEDTRTVAQRHHDALEDACRRLIASNLLPGRAGQPTQVQVQISLRDLLDSQPGDDGPAAEASTDEPHQGAWPSSARPGWLTGAAARAAACDATLIPVVTGHVNWDAVRRLADAFLNRRFMGQATVPPVPAQSAVAQSGADQPAAATSEPASSRETRERLERALLGLAIKSLSGPGGLAARLREAAGGPLATVSLPLDVGAATETIPAHLRRAAALRHPYCAFPGCEQAASVCDIHHIVPRSRGGPTSLPNLVPLCSFHHLVVIHRWNWDLRLHPDGTVTATSPRGRVLHSHGPPGMVA